MKTDNTYNGWTNHATWKVNLELGLNDYMDLYDGIDLELEPIHDFIKDYVEDSITYNCENELTKNYALCFLDDVDYYEIATHVLENLESLRD